MTNRTNPDLLKTTKLRAISMSEMVYGPRRRPLISRQIAFRAALLGALVGLLGCATAPRPVTAEVESVGQLSASYNSIAVAPVHASTDLTPAFGAVDTDEDAPVTVGAPAEKVEAPEIAPKTDGVTTGAVRQ